MASLILVGVWKIVAANILLCFWREFSVETVWRFNKYKVDAWLGINDKYVLLLKKISFSYFIFILKHASLLRDARTLLPSGTEF